mmetsp:Transcript_3590/g.22527  ORF Transcript_3590/g.22527 Transcript_3590/m.22527 type:complete len:246 (+) Transcript_3590:934-1671(+)
MMCEASCRLCALLREKADQRSLCLTPILRLGSLGRCWCISYPGHPRCALGQQGQRFLLTRGKWVVANVSPIHPSKGGLLASLCQLGRRTAPGHQHPLDLHGVLLMREDVRALPNRGSMNDRKRFIFHVGSKETIDSFCNQPFFLFLGCFLSHNYRWELPQPRQQTALWSLDQEESSLCRLLSVLSGDFFQNAKGQVHFLRRRLFHLGWKIQHGTLATLLPLVRLTLPPDWALSTQGAFGRADGRT